jgi:RIP metalloprotease RseP
MPTDYSSLHSLFSNIWGIIVMVLLFEGSIFVHELGHFLAAKRLGVRIVRFSLGFGPKVFGWTGKDGIEYRLSLLPLGGYVALPDLADLRELEGEPTPEAKEAAPIPYAHKMVILVAGAFFNILFAFVLGTLLWIVGLPSSSGAESNVLGYVLPEIPALGAEAPKPGPAYVAGLRPGDRILEVDGKVISDFRDFQMAIALGSGRAADGQPLAKIKFERAGAVQEVEVRPLLRETNTVTGDAIRQIGALPAEKLIVADIEENSPALAAGVALDDQLMQLDGQPVFSHDDFITRLNDHGTDPVKLTVLRGGKTQDITVQPARMPQTTPLAVISMEGGRDDQPTAKLDILPLFAQNSTVDRSSPTATAARLVVLHADGDEHHLGGLKVGDAIVEINGQKPTSVQEAVNALAATPAGQPARVLFFNPPNYSRTDVPVPFTASVKPSEQKVMIGVHFEDEKITAHPPPWQQFSAAVQQTFAMLSALVNPHSDVGVKMLSGPVGIGRQLQVFSMADIRLALWFTLMININLAILNLLPIPVLDGGHMLMATIAWLRGRSLPSQVIVTTQGLFLMCLMGLMLYVVFNDSMRWMGDNELDRKIIQEQNYHLKVNFPPAPAATSAPTPAPNP